MSDRLLNRGLPAALLLVALLLAAGAWGIDAATRQEVADAATAGPAITPVLAARRVPEFLVRPIAARRLGASLDGILAGVSGTTCLVVGDGTPIIDRNGGQPLSPASNQKLLTGSVAMTELGADTTFTTRFASKATIGADGTLSAPLWMIGGGDPVIDTDTYQRTLSHGRSPHTALESVADQLVAKGLRHVEGDVIGDDSPLDALRIVPSWPNRYLSDGQVGPLTGLSVNDARGYPATGAGGGVARPAADPPQYAASALVDLLRERGVIIDGSPVSGRAPDGLTTVLDVASLTMRDIVGEMLTFSDNNTAELLLKEIGRAAGEPSTAKGAAELVAQLGKEGFDTSGQVVTDGSGLDPTNRVSCRTLEGVLRAGGRDGDLAKGLPVAGRTGTLDDRYRGSPAVDKAHAKTGTLRDVVALSGWVDTDRGAHPSFSYILNSGYCQVGESEKRTAERVAEGMPF